MLNLGFDIPVKAFSIHLTLMAVFVPYMNLPAAIPAVGSTTDRPAGFWHSVFWDSDVVVGSAVIHNKEASVFSRYFTLASVLLVTASFSFAASITFTYTASGSGSLGGVPFGNTSFTITAVADTASRQGSSGAFFINHTSASVLISGLGDFVLTSPTRTFVDNSIMAAGLERAGTGEFGDLLDMFGVSVFGTWDMTTSVGPVSATGRLFQWNLFPVNTSGGVLLFNDGNPLTVFQATTAATIPEPGNFLLILIALVFLVQHHRAGFCSKSVAPGSI